jgi:hypothetical protein
LTKQDYRIINFVFAGVIGLVFIYSSIFSAEDCNYPIHSACLDANCASSGLSRAFSEIVRFNFESALNFNKHSLSVFSFFIIQLILRLLVNAFIKTKIKIREIVIIDIVFSITLFIITFKNIISF